MEATAAAKPALPTIAAWGDIEYPLDLDKPRDELDGLSLHTLAGLPFSSLSRFTVSGHWPAGYPTDRATFYSPHDPGVHAVEAWLHMQVDPHLGSLAKNMYGFDDPLLASIVRYWCDQPSVIVVVNLDRTQLGGRHEQEIMGLFRAGERGNSVAIGDIALPAPPVSIEDPLRPRQAPPGVFLPTPAPGQVAAEAGYMEEVAEGQSERSAISHLKLDVINRRLRGSGSTNQSLGGELKQDNELTIDTNPILAAQASVVVDLNHRIMRAQMKRRAEGG